MRPLRPKGPLCPQGARRGPGPPKAPRCPNWHQFLIFENRDPFAAAKRYVPGYIFLVGFVVAMVTLVKGLSHVGLEMSFGDSLLIAIGIGLVVMVIGILMENRVDRAKRQRSSSSHLHCSPSSACPRLQ